MFVETCLIVLALLATVLVTRHVTIKEYDYLIFIDPRVTDLVIRRKLQVAKLIIFVLFGLVLLLWSQAPS